MAAASGQVLCQDVAQGVIGSRRQGGCAGAGPEGRLGLGDAFGSGALPGAPAALESSWLMDRRLAQLCSGCERALADLDFRARPAEGPLRRPAWQRTPCRTPRPGGDVPRVFCLAKPIARHTLRLGIGRASFVAAFRAAVTELSPSESSLPPHLAPWPDALIAAHACRSFLPDNGENALRNTYRTRRPSQCCAGRAGFDAVGQHRPLAGEPPPAMRQPLRCAGEPAHGPRFDSRRAVGRQLGLEGRGVQGRRRSSLPCCAEWRRARCPASLSPRSRC